MCSSLRRLYQPQQQGIDILTHRELPRCVELHVRRISRRKWAGSGAGSGEWGLLVSAAPVSVCRPGCHQKLTKNQYFIQAGRLAGPVVRKRPVLCTSWVESSCTSYTGCPEKKKEKKEEENPSQWSTLVNSLRVHSVLRMRCIDRFELD